MKPAEWDSTVVSITADTPIGQATFKAGGRRLVFDGFLRVTGVDTGGEQILPALAENQPLAPLELEPSQHFTSPPPRYTEASLVKALEADGIGRPSTYATIIQTIQDRGYVEQRDRKFWATSLGEVVTTKLLQHFPRIMDVKFTSLMESTLDSIEESHLDWVKVLREFYGPFKDNLETAERDMQATRGEPSAHKCPDCDKPLAYRWGKAGRFLACTGYPECRFTCNVDREGNPVWAATTDHACQQCGKPMVVRSSRGKPFLGCSGYPECRFTVPCDETGTPLRKVKPEDIHETCDECSSPMAVKFKGRSAFLGCTKYPTCRGTKQMPADVYVEAPPKAPAEQAGVNCPQCGRPMVIRKGKRGPFVACSGYPKCNKTVPMERLEDLKKAARAAGAAADPAASGEAPGAPAMAKTSTTRNGKLVVESLDAPVSCPECGSRMQLRPAAGGRSWPAAPTRGARGPGGSRARLSSRPRSRCRPPRPSPRPSRPTSSAPSAAPRWSSA